MSINDTSGGGDILDELDTFLSRYYHEDVGRLAQRYPNEQRSLTIDYGDLFQFSPALADDLIEQPETVNGYLEEALRNYDIPVDVDFSRATVRVAGLNEAYEYNVGDYRSEHVGNYLAVRGQVSKASPVRPKAVEAVFDCQRCGTMTPVPQNGTEIQYPHECQSCERQGPFQLNKEQSQFVDHQMLRVQEPPEETNGGRGEFVDVHLEGDAVGEVQPGDRVTLAGTLDIEIPDQGSTMTPYVDGRAAEVEQTDYEEINVEEHKDRIEDLADDGDVYDLLVDSIAPDIRGHDEIKEAIVLQLFGGVRAKHPTGIVDRGDSHILLLGDPGTAKSSLLRTVEEIAPRSSYASGKGASAAGMTAAAVPDDFGQQKWSLEAGALVIANKGIACLDELDKINEETVSSMHDALESQRVNVNKAGINATLPAQTSVLAAGNPKYGRFDQYEPIGEQIDLPPALMSRFDLMFMLSDEPDEERDNEIAKHMVESRRVAVKNQSDTATVDDDELATIEPPIEKDVLRAYIAHAKQTVTPFIDDDKVSTALRQKFVELRQMNDGDDAPIPVTMRKLEAFQRLAEASARVRLSETVELEDVERAYKLVWRSMTDVGIDPESGEFDADAVEIGAAKSQRDRRKLVEDVIKELEESTDKGAPVDEVVEIVVQEGHEPGDVRHDIEEHFTRQSDIYFTDEAEEHVRWL